MRRREFVKQGGTLAVGTALWSCGAPSDKKTTEAVSETPSTEKEKYKFQEPSIQLYSLRNELPADRAGVLKQLSDIGFKNLETYMLEGEHHLGYPVAEFKKMLDDLGLQAVSAHIPTGRDNPDLEGTFINNFDKVIEDANFLGQKYIVCPYLVDFEREKLDDYKKLVDMLNESGEKCQQAGIQLAYHNHEFEFEQLEGVVPLEMMIEQTDPAQLQFELDIYWSTYANYDAVELFTKYPKRFPLWHVKDMSKENREDTTYLGVGSIDYGRVYDNADLAGLDYDIVEQEDYPIPVYDGLQKSYEHLKTLKA